MQLPEKSNWNILKGTWFVFKSDKDSVHILISNTGKQQVYINHKLVSEKRTIKTKSEHRIEIDLDTYHVTTFPNNFQLSSFSTELRKNEILLRSFTYYYKRDVKAIGILIFFACLTMVPIVLMKLPSWTMLPTAFFVVILVVKIFKNKLFVIEEFDNPINFDY